MTIWLIEPHDPLIFRDGRPFGATPGARANSLQFPFPSTIAGAVRARAGLDSNSIFRWNPKHYEQSERTSIEQQLHQLTQLAVRGPLLVQFPKNGADITSDNWMVPAPKDAVILPLKEEELPTLPSRDSYGWVKQLELSAFPPDAYYDLKQKADGLLLVGLQEADAGKPDGRAPRYWTWDSMLSWLLDPEQFQKHPRELQKLGHSGPGRETRTHVRLDAYARVGEPGMLFTTSGIEFIVNDTRAGMHLATAQDLGLMVIVDEREDGAENPASFELRAGPGCIGGERRIVNWRQSACKVPACPDALVKQIVADQACRLILLTPAYFTEGYIPSWITGQRDDVRLRPDLRAIAIDRPQVVSGWDLAKEGPKETRRLAPAGTVLFLSFQGSPEKDVEEWVSKTWMRCISDNAQDRTDGFGLAVLGRWSDNTQAREG